MGAIHTVRRTPPGPAPLIDLSGSAQACGAELGGIWREALHGLARDLQSPVLFANRTVIRALERYAPFLVDFFQGLAAGSGLGEAAFRCQFPGGEGCTSFAVCPERTLDRSPISGQTKDTPLDRIERYQVLRIRSDDFQMLMLTYSGMPFGHGFARGGCSLFRNSLYAGSPDHGLPYDIWGLLAMLQPTVGAVRDLTEREGVFQGFHTVIADEAGRAMGIESTAAGFAFLEPRDGIYTHANHVMSGDERLRACEQCGSLFTSSSFRAEQLDRLLRKHAGHLTAVTAFAALGDHEHYPESICSDARTVDPGLCTTAGVVVEPVKGLMHLTRGLPCQSFPETIAL